MRGRLSLTHAALIGLVVVVAGFITWNSVSASTSVQNLVVVAPTVTVLAILTLFILVRSLTRPAPDEDAGGGIWADVLLLAVFSGFCYSLTAIGFDVATFVFVWAGVVMSGSRGTWQPPLFAAVFTVLLVKGFGSVFPYPMTTLVL